MEFVNAGSLTKSKSTGITYFGTTGGTSNFTNATTGTLGVVGGNFYFNGGGAGTHTGAINVASGAEVTFARVRTPSVAELRSVMWVTLW